MSQDTGKFRKNTNDQFYTRVDVAKSCIDEILKHYADSSKYYWIEPSAGNGAFLKQVPEGIESFGMDIDPKDPQITKQDYLKWFPATSKKILVFGNPPFGRQSATAKAFIKHSAVFANIIAFILPLSFVKSSMNKAFPERFHCVVSKELPVNSFEINGQSYDVPCVFQIWERRDEMRQITEKIQPIGFQYVKSNTAFDLAFRRVGVYAGKSFKHGEKTFSEQSHYFLQFDNQFKPNLQKIQDQINAKQYPENTVGPRSISKQELNPIINQILQNLSS
jgi:hypothetical protein